MFVFNGCYRTSKTGEIKVLASMLLTHSSMVSLTNGSNTVGLIAQSDALASLYNITL